MSSSKNIKINYITKEEIFTEKTMSLEHFLEKHSLVLNCNECLTEYGERYWQGTIENLYVSLKDGNPWNVWSGQCKTPESVIESIKEILSNQFCFIKKPLFQKNVQILLQRTKII